RRTHLRHPGPGRSQPLPAHTNETLRLRGAGPEALNPWPPDWFGALDLQAFPVWNADSPGGVSERPPTSIVVTHCDVTQQMQICSRPCSLSTPLRGPTKCGV